MADYGSITWLRSLTHGRFSNQHPRIARLDVFQDNTRARRYQRLGFRETGHRIVHDRDGRIEVRIERPVNQALGRLAWSS